MIETNGASSVKYTPGCVIVLRTRPPASGDVAGARRAEVAQERGQRRHLRQVRTGAEHHPVVVAGDREDRPVVGAERLVELVVVVLALAEVVDDVAEVEEERRAGRRPAGRPPSRRRRSPRCAIACAAVWKLLTFAAPVSPTAWNTIRFERPGSASRPMCRPPAPDRSAAATWSASGPAGSGSCAPGSRASCSTASSCCRPGTTSRRLPAAPRQNSRCSPVAGGGGAGAGAGVTGGAAAARRGRRRCGPDCAATGADGAVSAASSRAPSGRPHPVQASQPAPAE